MNLICPKESFGSGVINTFPHIRATYKYRNGFSLILLLLFNKENHGQTIQAKISLVIPPVLKIINWPDFHGQQNLLNLRLFTNPKSQKNEVFDTIEDANTGIFGHLKRITTSGAYIPSSIIRARCLIKGLDNKQNTICRDNEKSVYNNTDSCDIILFWFRIQDNNNTKSKNNKNEKSNRHWWHFLQMQRP